MQSDNKTLTQSLLTRFYVVIWGHSSTMCWWVPHELFMWYLKRGWQGKTSSDSNEHTAYFPYKYCPPKPKHHNDYGTRVIGNEKQSRYTIGILCGYAIGQHYRIRKTREYGYHIREIREYGYHIRKTKWYGYADHVGCSMVNFAQCTG